MEAFYNSRKRAAKKRNLTPTPPVKTVEISTLACWLFMSQVFDKKMQQSIRMPGANFNAMTIDNNNPLRIFIDSMLQGYEIAVARLFEFVPEQKTCAHIDNLFPQREVIIIRLNDGDSRLKINSQLVHESPGKGYIVPSNTLYEISTGVTVRYSLVLWGNRKCQL